MLFWIRVENDIFLHFTPLSAMSNHLTLFIILQVEKLKDLCLGQREEIRALKSSILFPDISALQLQKLLEKQGLELRDAREVIPNLQEQVSSLTGQIRSLAEGLAEVISSEPDITIRFLLLVVCCGCQIVITNVIIVILHFRFWKWPSMNTFPCITWFMYLTMLTVSLYCICRSRLKNVDQEMILMASPDGLRRQEAMQRRLIHW